MAEQHSQAPVSVIGLGPMGAALATAFLDHGHPTTVWNRSPHKADDLVAKGARRASTVAEAISASPTVIVCIKDYEAMYDTLAASGEDLKGRVLVNLNSGTPAQAREAAAWSAERGADYLDGAIMVPPALVGAPGAVFLYSGSPDVFDRHKATLVSAGDPRHLGPDPTLAVLYNTALLDLMYATMNGFLHATALVGSANVPATEFADLALDWFTPAVVISYLRDQAPSLDKAHYPGDSGTMEMNLSALDHITRTSEEQGVHPALPRLMKEIAEQTIAAGHADKNYLSVYETFKTRGRTPRP